MEGAGDGTGGVGAARGVLQGAVGAAGAGTVAEAGGLGDRGPLGLDSTL